MYRGEAGHTALLQLAQEERLWDHRGRVCDPTVELSALGRSQPECPLPELLRFPKT